MKKITIGLIILMSFALIMSCSTDEKVAEAKVVDAPFHATFAAAQAEAQETGKDILIDFYTDW